MLEFGGICARIIALARFGKLKIDISEAILNETVAVLRDDFGWDGYRLRFMELEMRRMARGVSPTSRIAILRDDPDNRILECAVEAGSQYRITHDKDLLRLRDYERIRIFDGSAVSG